MSAGREFLPRTPVITVLTWLAAAATFVALVIGWSDGPPAAERVVAATAGAPAHFPATAALERSWVEAVLPTAYLPRAVAGVPCVSDIPMTSALRRALAGALAIDSNEQLSQVHQRFLDSWLPGLLLGQRLLRHGDTARALDVLQEVYARPRVRSLMERVRVSARSGNPRSAPPTVEVLAVIHLLHAYGLAQIEARVKVGEGYWRALKNPIGAVRVLSGRGVTGTLVDAPTHDQHRLPAPGCPQRKAQDVDSLTSLDLYNNLIVGYLRGGAFEETDARREREFRRDYEDRVGDNPLQQVLQAAVEQLIPEQEYWVWALSNAERLLRDRRLSSFGTVTNPLLALNLAQLIADAEARDLTPAAGAALRREREDLVASARDHRETVAAAQRPRFDVALARALLLSGIRSTTVTTLPADVRGHLDEPAGSVADAVAAALEARADPDRRARVATADQTGAADLLGPALTSDGRRAARWRAALRSDVAGLMATNALTSDDPAAGARLARRVLRQGDEAPSALATLRGSLGPLDRLRLWWAGWRGIGRWLLAVVAAAVVWKFGRWWAVQWRRRKSLFSSFYRREAQARLNR